MRCRSCGSDNPEGKRFCGDCATSLGLLCPKCGVENPPEKKFCGDCATSLSTSPAAPLVILKQGQGPPLKDQREATSFSEPPSDGERKTITALFADIKGSMELIEDLDPEEARAIIDPALHLMMDAVHHYGGHVAQSTGDGIFALFGAPTAHEDHPQRALYGALRMQEEMRRYAERLRAQGRAPVEIRIGINTGEVVVRSLRTGEQQDEYVPLGHSTSLAARMQAIAPTGAIAITEHTRRQVEGYFQLRALGPAKVKGLSEPINVYEVTGLGALRTRLQLSAQRGLTRFVGRQAEMEALKKALASAGDGKGQIAAALGDPGVGKSRLFFEFKATLPSSDAGNGWRVLETYSVSHGKATAYLPVIELLNNYFEITPGDDDQRRRERITGKLLTLDRSLEDTLPLFFTMLGVEETVGGAPARFAGEDPQVLRRRMIDSIKRLLLRESLRQPLIVVFEDLHWLDDESQALLNLLVESIATARILILVNYRPEYRHGWGNKTYYTQLRLDALGKDSAKEMLDAAIGDSPDLYALKQMIIDRTDGNPFFMEEVIQALVEEGAIERNGIAHIKQAVNEIRIPPTVQGILAARIDRLPARDKELLQTLAVIGKEFPLSLLKALVGESDHDLIHRIERLQKGEFIYEQPAVGDTEYMFKHALTQEVAYNSVLSEKRKSLHERIGSAIEELYAGRIDDHLSELAHHYRRSSNSEKAVEFLIRSEVQSEMRSAFAEAIEQARTALGLLDPLPADAGRARQELNLQAALARVLSLMQGPGGEEIGQRLGRARELAAQVGDDSALIPVLWSLRLHHYSRGEFETSLHIGEELLAVTKRTGNNGLNALAYSSLAHTLLQIGEFTRARECADSAIAFYDPTSSLIGALGNTKILSLYCNASAIWALGYPSQALALSRESVSAARQDGRPLSLSVAFWQNAFFRHLVGDVEGAGELAEAAVAIAKEHGFRLFEQLGKATKGWAMAMKGHPHEGVSEISAAVEGLRAMTRADARINVMWAEASAKAGQLERGLSIVEDGFERIRRTRECQFEAEHWRVRGDLLLLARRSEDEAERCFEKAIAIARDQNAKSFELRTTMSLARLLAKQGKRDEAHQMLAEIYNWFTEGFDTPDLKDAKALLDELSS